MQEVLPAGKFVKRGGEGGGALDGVEVDVAWAEQLAREGGWRPLRAPAPVSAGARRVREGFGFLARGVWGAVAGGLG